MDFISMITPEALVFFGLATLAVAGALGVALASNILYSGFALMATLGGVAGLYLFIGLDFLGIAQLLIYVGGILVLILFAVLLTNRIGAVNVTNVSAPRALGGVGALGLLGLLTHVAVKTDWVLTTPVSTPTTARIGDAFLREYLLPFEVASIVLLMSLVGAMVIARRAVRDRPLPPVQGAAAPAPDGAERLL